MLSKFVSDITAYFEKLGDVLFNRTKDVLLGFGGLAVMYGLSAALTLILFMVLGFSFTTLLGSIHNTFLSAAGRVSPVISLTIGLLAALTPFALLWFITDVIGRGVFSAYVIPPFFDKPGSTDRIISAIIYLVLNSLLFLVVGAAAALFFGLLIFLLVKILHVGMLILFFSIGGLAIIAFFLLMPLCDYVFAGMGEVLLEAAEPVQTFLRRLGSLITLSGGVLTRLIRFFLLRLLLMGVSVAIGSILSLPMMFFMLIPLVGGMANFALQLFLLAINTFLYTTAVVYIDRL